MNEQQRTMALLGAGYGVGAAGLVAPKAVAAVFGMRDVSDNTVAVLRMLSTRNIALAGVLQLLGADDRLQKRFFALAAAMFSADTVTALLTAATGRTSWRSALSLAGVSGALAAISATGAAVR